MQTNRILSPGPVLLALFCAAFLSTTVVAEDSGSASRALQTARKSLPASVQNKVVSVYGTGTPEIIQKWYIIFYDPSVTSHGRAVMVENNQVTKTYVANGGVVYSADLAFDPSHISSEGPALSAAQGYAAKHHLAYDSVTALFKQTSRTQPFHWKISMMKDGKNLGSVLVNTPDSSIAAYAPPGTAKTSAPAATTTPAPATTAPSSDTKDKGFFHDVGQTFLHVGGDMEEFFTGDRTVDKDKSK